MMTSFLPEGQVRDSLCTDVPRPSEKNREKKRSFSKGGGTSVHRLGPENGYGQAGMGFRDLV